MGLSLIHCSPTRVLVACILLTSEWGRAVRAISSEQRVDIQSLAHSNSFREVLAPYRVAHSVHCSQSYRLEFL